MIADIFTLALVLWGVAALFDEGMILEGVGNYLEARLPRKVLKPFILCPACMSSVYGAIWSFYFSYSIEQWVILTFAVCGLNYLIMKILTR